MPDRNMKPYLIATKDDLAVGTSFGHGFEDLRKLRPDCFHTLLMFTCEPEKLGVNSNDR
jgi:hypothetical protein